MIVFPWGKYHYKCSPMVISNSPEIYQHKINDFSLGFESIYAYINDLLVLKKGDLTDHVEKLDLTLKIKIIRLKCNIEKYLFGQIKMEYLGFWVTCEGVRLIKNNLKQ